MGFANCQLPMMSHNVFVLTAALLCAINVTATPVTDITAPTTYEGAKSIVWDRFAEDRRASNASNGTIAPTSAPTVAGPIVSFTLSLSDVSLVQFDTAFEMAYVNTLATGLTNATGVNVSTSQIYDVKASALRRAAGISVSQKISLPSGTTASVATDFATSTHAYLVTDFASQLSAATGINVGNVTVTSAPTVSGLPSSSSSGLGAGWIVLIVIASVVGLCLCAALGYYLVRRSNDQKEKLVRSRVSV